jgi:hypothetical protein
VIRTRYERYIGQFVPHCHSLDHEDQGMMPNVSIGIPRRTGRHHTRSPSNGHHWATEGLFMTGSPPVLMLS